MRLSIYSILFIASLQAPHAYGQGCKISISYDENGNRILRELVCFSARENPEEQDKDPMSAINTYLPFKDQEQNLSSSFKVYPNPTNDLIYIEIEAKALQEKCSFVLSDISGKVHMRKEITTSRTNLSLTHLADGVYFLTLFRRDQRDVVKIVKEAGTGGF